MQKETKKQKAERELEERLKKMAAKHHVVQPISNPLLERAREKLKPDFGLEAARSTSVSQSSGREILGASSEEKEFGPGLLNDPAFFVKRDEENYQEKQSLALRESTSDKSAFPRSTHEESASHESTSKKSASENQIEALQSPIQKIEVTKSKRRVPQRKWKLFSPSWKPDFSIPFEEVTSYLYKLVGSKHATTMRLYLELYSRAKHRNSVMLHVKRKDLLEILGTNSSGTVTRAVVHAEELGLLTHQVFPFASGDVEPGTYIFIKFPWKNL